LGGALVGRVSSPFRRRNETKREKRERERERKRDDNRVLSKDIKSTGQKIIVYLHLM
jgi:hypothetical protein